MTTELEDQITRVLSECAKPVPDSTDVEAYAFRRGRRLRTRRRVLTGVAGLAVAAVAVPVALAVRPGTGPGYDPAGTPEPLQVHLDPTKLPRGAAPKLPWIAQGTIHDGNRTIAPPDPNPKWFDFSLVKQGYLAWYTYPEKTQVRLIGRDGGLISKVKLFPVDESADGRRWLYDDAELFTVVDRKTGKRMRTPPNLRNQLAPPPGFLGRSVVYGHHRLDQSLQVAFWNPDTGKVTYDSRTSGFFDVNDEWQQVLAAVGEDRCTALFEGDRPEKLRMLWKRCDGAEVAWLSTDGRYVFSATGDRLLIRDANSARPLFELTGATSFAGNSEPDGSLLVISRDILWPEEGQGKEAIVRIKPDGTAERVTDIRKPDTYRIHDSR